MKLMSYIVFSLICAFQVKPLLQVTRQDEEIQARETQLLKAKENLNQVEQNYTDLERKHVQVDEPPHPDAAGSAPPAVAQCCFCNTVAAGGESSAGRPAADGSGAVSGGRGDEGQAGQS